MNFAKQKVLVPPLNQQSCLAGNIPHAQTSLEQDAVLQLLFSHHNLSNMIVGYSDVSLA